MSEQEEIPFEDAVMEKLEELVEIAQGIREAMEESNRILQSALSAG